MWILGLKGLRIETLKNNTLQFLGSFGWTSVLLIGGCPDYYQVQVQVLVHLFTHIQLQYNNKEKKEEVKTELTIH